MKMILTVDPTPVGTVEPDIDLQTVVMSQIVEDWNAEQIAFDTKLKFPVMRTFLLDLPDQPEPKPQAKRKKK